MGLKVVSMKDRLDPLRLGAERPRTSIFPLDPANPGAAFGKIGAARVMCAINRKKSPRPTHLKISAKRRDAEFAEKSAESLMSELDQHE